MDLKGVVPKKEKAFWKEAHLERSVDLNRHHKAFDFIKDQVYLAK